MSEFIDGGVQWPPIPADFYLPQSLTRPVMQGDVFDDVPFTKTKRGNRRADPPHIITERRTVAVLGYTCDIYIGGRLAKVQTVAPVIDAEKAGIPEDWDGAFTVAPVPDLRGDGRMYAIDLRATGNVDAFYFDREHRIRSLSEIGWAVLRQRMGLASGRVLAHLDDFIGAGRDVWDEIGLWQLWNDRGLPEDQFQPWLNTHARELGGFSYRMALYRGMTAAVRAAVNAVQLPSR